ncbi:MAG: protein kinase domain-containing protein [Candidatus Longimicrobiales bacterium M2_2A_002]
MSGDGTVARLNAALEGRYRIDRKLGEGGMATVYLAEDLRHRRQVALKVLKPELAAVVGAERFLAEIETTANLQHPHILPLYDSGEADSFLFYVMPYVEDESLREKLDRERQLPIDDAVRIARAVAAGLDYAHRQGVVHRDIKPANILLQDGEPVIADFGIALAIQEAGGGRLTETGLSLGTPYYMSPEQATADRDPDARSDVYSLGCVLYEMLTGEPPFTGNTAQSVLGKILTADAVAPRQLRSTIPAHVEAAVLRSLAKVPADRFGSAADLARALDEGGAVAYPPTAAGAPGAAGAPAGARSRLAARAPWVVAGLFAVLAAVAGLGRATGDRDDPGMPGLRAILELPERSHLDGTRIAISDDGTVVAVRALHDGRPVLMARPTDALEFFPVPGTYMADQQFLSPDGGTLAFRAAGGMRRVPVAGGPVITMDPDGAWAGGDWTEDGTVIYSRSYRSGLWRLTNGGGEPERLTQPEDDELGHWWPQVLPDGEHVLFTAFRTPISASRISVLSLETGERTELFEGGVHAKYVPTGHILYVRAGALYAVPFNLEGLSIEGEGVPVVADVAMDHSSGMGAYDVAGNGTLVYIRASELNAPSELVWVDRSGRETPILTDSGLVMTPALSPDGRAVALTAFEPGEAEDIWTVDLIRGTRTRVTSGGGSDFGPIWTPDGESVIFTSEQPVFDLYLRRARGSAPASPLVASDYDKYVGGFTPDGGHLIYSVAAEPGEEIWRVAVDGGSEPERVHAPEAGAYQPAVSPNGRWLVYASPESGRLQIYLASYPDPSELRRQVSVDGGSSPRWSRGGREVVYQDGGSILAVSVDPETGELGRPERLFEGAYLDPAINFTRNYDVTADGERFLMVKRARERAPRRVVVVTGFFDQLRSLTEGRP